MLEEPKDSLALSTGVVLPLLELSALQVSTETLGPVESSLPHKAVHSNLGFGVERCLLYV